MARGKFKSKLKPDGNLPEEMASGDIIREASEALRFIDGSMRSRRGRDQASRSITDLWRCVEMLSRRIGRPDSFEERGASRVDADEDLGDWEAAAEGEGDPMTLAASHSEAEAEAVDVGSVSLGDLLNGDVSGLEEGVADELGVSVRQLRIGWYGKWMRYMAGGARSLDEVSKRALALIRPAAPELLMPLCGVDTAKEVSKAAVARALGEKGRANVHAREKKWFEEPQKKAGVKGYKGVGGQRSEDHRAKCKSAQRNNRNRVRGAMKRAGVL